MYAPVLRSLDSTIPPRPRFFSEEDCRTLAQRLFSLAEGGGDTRVMIVSKWTGHIRWARNHISTAGEQRNNTIQVERTVRGAHSRQLITNDLSDAGLVAAMRGAERMAALHQEAAQSDLHDAAEALTPGPHIFSESTYQLNAARRADAARRLTKFAAEAGMRSAGYVQVSAHGMAILDSTGHSQYFSYTQAQYSVTVRDPKGTGSGWAGMDHYDWSKIDGEQLSEVALDKCLRSRDPVRIEPGRYTVILEPQAVSDFVGQLFHTAFTDGYLIGRGLNEGDAMTFHAPGPFQRTLTEPYYSMIGSKVVDERITVTTDALDPLLGYPPFSVDGGNVYHPATWIAHGVLTDLAYSRGYAMSTLAKNNGLPNPGGFRMSGGQTSPDEMIATTKRGLIVTRFDNVVLLDTRSALFHGYTRDGLWLVENGKISHPVKNLAFTESPLFSLNRVEHIGPAQRVFHPMADDLMAIPTPVVVPTLKIQDFSFTSLSDAV